MGLPTGVTFIFCVAAAAAAKACIPDIDTGGDLTVAVAASAAGVTAVVAELTNIGVVPLAVVDTIFAFGFRAASKTKKIGTLIIFFK